MAARTAELLVTTTAIAPTFATLSTNPAEILVPASALAPKEATPGSRPAEQIVNSGGVVTSYKMRGFYPTGGVYEEWVAVGNPNNTPPSGHVLVNIVVEGVWTQ